MLDFLFVHEPRADGADQGCSRALAQGESKKDVAPLACRANREKSLLMLGVLGSGKIAICLENRSSISDPDTPCRWHFWRLPSSQSKPEKDSPPIFKGCMFVHTNVNSFRSRNCLIHRGAHYEASWGGTKGGHRRRCRGADSLAGAAARRFRLARKNPCRAC